MKNILILSITAVLLLSFIVGCTPKGEVVSPSYACNNIEDINLREECYIDVAKESLDETICDNIESNRTRSFCYKESAVSKGDIKVCDKIIDDSFWWNTCYIEVAKKTLDPHPCYQVSPLEDKDECLKEVIVNKGDAKLCLDISKSGDEPGCILEIAKDKGDYTLCDLNTRSIDENTCYYRMAKYLNNSLICSNIDMDTIKLSCQSYFN